LRIEGQGRIWKNQENPGGDRKSNEESHIHEEP